MSQHIQTQGSLLAMRTTLACLLAKVAEEDASILNRLHAVLAQSVEQATEPSRQIAADPSADQLFEALEAAAVRELDAMFSMASDVLRGKDKR